MSRIAAWVAEELAEEDRRDGRSIKWAQVAVRVPEKHMEMLDAIADQLGYSRSGMGGMLLRFGIEEAANTMNLGWVPDDDGVEQVVMFSEDKE